MKHKREFIIQLLVQNEKALMEYFEQTADSSILGKIADEILDKFNLIQKDNLNIFHNPVHSGHWITDKYKEKENNA